MKKTLMVVLLLMILPCFVWAKDPSNAELYKMFKELEVKLDKAISEANKAKAEADKAKKEAVRAKKEAAKAKDELARIQNASPSAVSTDTLVKASKTDKGIIGSYELLYLRPSQSGLDFVVVDNRRTGNIRGSYKSLDPYYDWGGRAGLRYDFGTGADIGLTYSWLETHDSESANRKDNEDLWGIWLHPNAIIDDNDVTHAGAIYQFKYSVFDLGLGQNIDIGKHFGLRVEGGLRYAEIDQDFDIRYIQQVTSTLNRRVYIEHENDFSGWGGRVGLGLDWRVGWGFNIFTAVAGSVMVGDFELSLMEHDYQVAAVNGTRRVDVEQTYENRVIPVVETRAGIGYSYRFENGWTVGALAGYEWQNWFNMVSVRRYTDDVDNQLADVDTTDIGLDGFFFEVYMHF